MPTVILLDVSLSMARYASVGDGETYQKKHIAVHCINRFLDYLSAHVKLEHVCLIVFSSLWELLVPFTRDYDLVKSALNSVCLYDKTCLDSAISAVSTTVAEAWGNTLLTHVLLVTDGWCSPGEAEQLRRRLPQLLPFSFPCKMHVIKLCSPGDEAHRLGPGHVAAAAAGGTGPAAASAAAAVHRLYQQLAELGTSSSAGGEDRSASDSGAGSGEVYAVSGAVTLKAAEALIDRLTESHYSPFVGSVSCGHLKSKIQLFPAPEKFHKVDDFYDDIREVSKDIKIVGFLNTGDVSSPPCVSRHLVLPLTEAKAASGGSGAAASLNSGACKAEDEGDDTKSEDGRTPSFTVLLHGALKIENMVALAQVSDDWYGMLYSWADSKKKSNLMMSLFKPGLDAVPWLGDLSSLAPSNCFKVSPYGDGDKGLSPFPVTAVDKKSYAVGMAVWLKPNGLHADIQKILRHARKLPEKQQPFYKELNRVYTAAVSFGFAQLLPALAAMLERECTLLPENAHPDAMLQLTHAASSLKSLAVAIASGANMNAHSILPLSTNFSHTSGVL